MDYLQEIFAMQKEFATRVNNDRYPDTLDGRISVLATAMVHEAVELQRLTDWKWWKKSDEFDMDAAKEELVDVLHFAIQAALEIGMSAESLYKAYRRKTGINHARQDGGY